ncbi:MAG TPA: acyl-CoA dehydrogenase family protein [Microbacteriaceae bacterium]|nr:acyl-CoA dehydrogenase family protein [Microbacteriaceae bacterium]
MSSTTAVSGVRDHDDQGRPRLIDMVRQLEPEIRAIEREMDERREVPQELTDALYDMGVYRSWLPAELGGLEVDLIEWLECIEEAARINGSIGWLCMLHRGDTSIPAVTMRKILEQGRWITAGNLGRAAGKAVKVEGGYRVSGRWPFSSGAPEATWFFGRSVLHGEDGEPVIDPRNGMPLTMVPYFPASDVILHDTWDGLGLRATGSGDFEVIDAFVPDELMDESGFHSRPYDGPLYRGRFFQLGQGAHTLGMARAAIDAFIDLAHQSARRGSYRQARLGREQVHQLALAKADSMVRAGRAFLWEIAEAGYEQAKHQEVLDFELRVRIHQANAFAVSLARKAVQLVFEQAGSPTVYRGHALERIHRDMETGAQHALVAESSLDRVGQYLISRDLPGGPEIELGGIGFILGPYPQNERSAESGR